MSKHFGSAGKAFYAALAKSRANKGAAVVIWRVNCFEPAFEVTLESEYQHTSLVKMIVARITSK